MKFKELPQRGYHHVQPESRRPTPHSRSDVWHWAVRADQRRRTYRAPWQPTRQYHRVTVVYGLPFYPEIAAECCSLDLPRTPIEQMLDQLCEDPEPCCFVQQQGEELAAVCQMVPGMILANAVAEFFGSLKRALFGGD